MQNDNQVLISHFTNRCECGNCSTQHLANAKECLCCKEIYGCMLALEDDEVLEAVGNVSCVTKHPGFAPVCLKR